MHLEIIVVFVMLNPVLGQGHCLTEEHGIYFFSFANSIGLSPFANKKQPVGRLSYRMTHTII